MSEEEEVDCDDPDSWEYNSISGMYTLRLPEGRCVNLTQEFVKDCPQVVRYGFELYRSRPLTTISALPRPRKVQWILPVVMRALFSALLLAALYFTTHQLKPFNLGGWF